MINKLEIVQVESVNELVLDYVKNAAQDFVVGFSNDTQKNILSVRFLEGLHGFAGISSIEKGNFHKEFFRYTDEQGHDYGDLYATYSFNSDAVEFINVSSINNFDCGEDSGSRYKLNFKDRSISVEPLSTEEVNNYIKILDSPSDLNSITEIN
jgi:hypothetical protein